jgi:hypothetical protein
MVPGPVWQAPAARSGTGAVPLLAARALRRRGQAETGQGDAGLDAGEQGPDGPGRREAAMVGRGELRIGRPASGLRWVAWSFALPGLGLIAGAGVAVWMEMAFRRGAVETRGEIVRMVQHGTAGRTGSEAPGWTPVFAFRLPDGKRIEVEAGYSTNPPCCRVGDAVTVLYDPAAPGRARMDGFMDSWFVATLLGGIGLVFLLIGRLVARLLRGFTGRMAAPAAGRMALRVEARLAGLRREATARGPGWVVQARGTDPRDGAERLFESAPLPFDPKPQMMRMRSVTVLVDPASMGGAYSIDLSFLRPPAAPVGPVRRG